MTIETRFRGIEDTRLLRRIVERKLRYSLGRFSHTLAGVAADLGDENGPRGGIDKYCRVRVTTRRGAEVFVEAVDSTIHAAVDRATERIARVLDRQAERRRDLRRDVRRGEARADIW